MKKNKRTVCLITNWYPTSKNPYNGIFFKEQALALEDYFDFIVVHYKENNKDLFIKNIIRFLKGKSYTIEKINEEKNTVEYNVASNIPLYYSLFNMFSDFYRKHVKHSTIAGVGHYYSKQYDLKKRKILEKIFKENFENQIDILYCVSAQTEGYTLQCISEAIKKPYIVAEHAPFPWPGTTISDVSRNAIENADLLLAISYDKIRQILLQNIKPKKVAYVGNMVNEEQFVLTKGSNKEKTFIIVAAHSFYKNYDLFIEIFNRVTEITDVPFKVMIVGYGSNKGYSKNSEVLEDKVRNSKFARYAELIPEVSHDNIHELYGRSDAFVMTSIQEGMPVSALEAGCCGLPIFSTMCGGVEDYVDEKTGRIFRIIDSESFAIGIKDFLEGKISFDNEYIRARIAGKYGKKSFLDRMVKEFNCVIDEHKNIQ